MDPKLIVLTGASKGAILIIQEELSIGRDAENLLRLQDNRVSRCHAVIRREKSVYKIFDLESYNGTLVNGIPVNEQTLKHRDRIQIGDNVFVFLLYEEKELSGLNNVEVDESSVLTMSPVPLNLEDALCSMARDLNLLIKVSATIQHNQVVESTSEATARIDV